MRRPRRRQPTTLRAININGKTGPWSNVGRLEATVLERFWLVSPNSSTVDVHLEVWHPDGNPLYVRYQDTSDPMSVRYAEQRLTQKGYPVIGLPVQASTHYRVDVDFVETFDSPRLRTATVWSLQEGADPYTSPYAVDALDAQVWQGGAWREAPDTALTVRMGGTGKYRVRLKPCDRIYSVIPRRIQAPAGRLGASPTDFDPALFSNLDCEVEGIGYRTDENGNRLTMSDVYDMTNFPDRANDFIPIYGGSPNDWYEVTVPEAPRPAPAPAPEPAISPVHADPPLGVEIAALGPRSRAVFQASARVAHGLDGRPVDVALADTPAQATGIDTPAAVLAAAPALSVPAFDPAVHNPVGWVREVEPRAAALGPPGLLPPGVRAYRAVAADDLDALRHCHHVEDVSAFHAGAAARAGTLVRLAAGGTPVHLADRDPALEALVGVELHALMLDPVPLAGAAAREALSIGMRRAALRAHSLGARARQLCAAACVDPPELPLVSVVLATRRPGRLAMAVANVARQRYPHLELVLALHGPGFEEAAVARACAGFAYPPTVLRVGAERPLGAVLNAATAAAAGALLAKMDDDDVYGSEHLWDLVLAHEYSGAALVGKFPATVYLAARDRTVRRRRVRSETWSRSITGGAMLVGRAALERAGGWRPVRRHVDAALVDDVARAGGGVYRTHDAGYVLVRHGEGHTWEADDAVFLAQAEAVRPGWCPALAGMKGVPPPVPDRAGAGRAA